ncbi:16S rRNA (guanine(527)-N(7))-methyltransferase RsmG [Nocardioides litoris]|uniref:16S rRNA (guanine(527)-N(7))-methyltransferase RsmG n=1 Tax=Nocardioides litoris TaxID=1926648 RepID=UPI0011244D9C|nr:16S rRNA (guanine(527)-N(7))-methyltransferase RsmG [Nocardioides litoris]
MSDVSRETSAETPPAPPSARGAFGSRLDLAERYAARLASDGLVRGVIGPREVPRVWSRHLVNSALLGELVPHGASVADVGSGAGLPGVPLAIARPDLTVTLIEPLLRRTRFLEEVVDDLELDNVVVRRGRAEELHTATDLRPGFDVVTARAVAPLGRLVGWCLPLVAPAGALTVLKGSSLDEELQEAQAVLRHWGATDPAVTPLGDDGEDRTWAVTVRWTDPSRASWPARPAAAARGGRRRRR